LSRTRAAVAAFVVTLALGGAAAAQKKTGAILPGGNSNKPINIEATKLDYFDKEQKLIYTGNVLATQGDAKLKASVLTIFLAPKGEAKGTGRGEAGGESTSGAGSSNQVQRMLAAGPVTLIQRDQVGTGDSGVYDRMLDTVVLTGNVVLTQGPNVTKGDRLVYDLKTGHASVTGKHVMGMFQSESGK
jgi:lipopolysaccharide export system protein LptA